jgi:hypothetical protein
MPSLILLLTAMISMVSLLGAEKTQTPLVSTKTTPPAICTYTLQGDFSQERSRQLNFISEGPVRLQPVIVARQANADVLKQRWATFAQSLPAQLAGVTLRPIVLMDNGDLSQKGEAFPDRLKPTAIAKRLAISDTNTMIVVYPDFGIVGSEQWDAPDHLYISQLTTVILGPDASKSARVFEIERLIWLASLHQPTPA